MSGAVETGTFQEDAIDIYTSAPCGGKLLQQVNLGGVVSLVEWSTQKKKMWLRQPFQYVYPTVMSAAIVIRCNA